MTTVFAKRTHNQAFRTTADIFEDMANKEQHQEKTHFEEQQQHGRNHEKKDNTKHPTVQPQVTINMPGA